MICVNKWKKTNLFSRAFVQDILDSYQIYKISCADKNAAKIQSIQIFKNILRARPNNFTKI